MTEETRAVPAAQGRLTPLVVLIPSLATVVFAVIALVSSHSFAQSFVVILVGLAITAWVGSRWYSWRLVVGTAVLTLGGGALGTAFLVLFALGSALGCMSEVSDWWVVGAVASGALVFLAVATPGFRAGNPLAVVTLGLILGLITIGVAFGFVPQTPDPGCSS